MAWIIIYMNEQERLDDRIFDVILSTSEYVPKNLKERLKACEERNSVARKLNYENELRETIEAERLASFRNKTINHNIGKTNVRTTNSNYPVITIRFS